MWKWLILFSFFLFNSCFADVFSLNESSSNLSVQISNVAGTKTDTDGIPFTYSIHADKNSYALGEPITVTFTLKNISPLSQKIEKWRGALNGVSHDPKKDEYDFAIYYCSGSQLQRLEYHGLFACGPPCYMPLNPEESWNNTVVINQFEHPAYSLEIPGEYLLRSIYFSSPVSLHSDAFKGKIFAPEIRISIKRLSENELQEIRHAISPGDPNAVAIIAAHRDVNSAPILNELCTNENPETRSLAYTALARIGTDDCLDALGRAALAEPDYGKRLYILNIFREAKNPVVIPYLKQLLNDSYIASVGMNGKHYQSYLVRRDASSVLNLLGIPDNTPYLFESQYQSPIESLPAESRKLLYTQAVSKDHKIQFDAVYTLATSGYSQRSAKILTDIACDSNTPITTREYCAMGISNFTQNLPNEEKETIRENLIKVLSTETYNTPVGILRTLNKWGCDKLIAENLGEHLKNHPLEFDILAQQINPTNMNRLWEIYQNNHQIYYSNMVALGKTLMDKDNIQGLDFLMKLLTDNNISTPQQKYDLFRYISGLFRDDFAYGQDSYPPELEKAITRMAQWWQKNRDAYKSKNPSGRY